jgi:multidrug resistance efflux pump
MSFAPFAVSLRSACRKSCACRKTGAGRTRRAGISWTGLSGTLVAVAVVPLMAWYAIPQDSFSAEEDGPLTEQVQRGTFVHELIERGEVESSSTVDVRCEVQSRGSGGTALLEIVPEGTRVKEGDIICKLDSSSLENERNAQQIVVNGSTSALIGATAALETARIAKQEYLEGTYKNEEKLIQSEIFVAEQNLKRATEYLKHSQKLAARGFVSPQTLEADEFAVEKAQKDLEIAKTKLKVLQDYTKAKMLNQLDAAIETAEADLGAKKNINHIDIEKLKQIEQQIEKCTVRAPQEGEVTYANSTDMRDSDAVIIKEGVIIRERQTIVRLPDPQKMQVNAKVNESKIRLIKIGMPATIRIEALPDVELQGTVAKVFAYANRSRWSSSTVKEFSVIVEIHDPPAELRTGSTAEVEIRVHQSPDELMVPVQAVLEHGGQHFCVWRKGEGWVTKPVELGPTNDSMVVIKSGITESDQVVLNPRAYLDELNLPELPAKVIKAEEMLVGTQPLKGGPPSKGATGNPAGSNPVAANGNGPGEAAGPGQSGGQDRASGMLQRMDRNGDGRLARDEVPPQMEGRFPTVDKNADGFLDADELSSMPMGNRRPGGEGALPGGQRAIGGGAGQ